MMIIVVLLLIVGIMWVFYKNDPEYNSDYYSENNIIDGDVEIGSVSGFAEAQERVLAYVRSQMKTIEKGSTQEIINYICSFPKNYAFFISEAKRTINVCVTRGMVLDIASDIKNRVIEEFVDASRRLDVDDCRVLLNYLKMSMPVEAKNMGFENTLSILESIRVFYATESGFLTRYIVSGGNKDSTTSNCFFKTMVGQLINENGQMVNFAGLAFAIKDLYKKRYEEQKIPVDLICAIVFVQKVYGEAVLSLMQIDAEKISAEFNSYATACQRKIVGDFLQACNHYTERFAQ